MCRDEVHKDQVPFQVGRRFTATGTVTDWQLHTHISKFKRLAVAIRLVADTMCQLSGADMHWMGFSVWAELCAHA